MEQNEQILILNKELELAQQNNAPKNYFNDVNLFNQYLESIDDEITIKQDDVLSKEVGERLRKLASSNQSQGLITLIEKGITAKNPTIVKYLPAEAIAILKKDQIKELKTEENLKNLNPYIAYDLKKIAYNLPLKENIDKITSDSKKLIHPELLELAKKIAYKNALSPQSGYSNYGVLLSDSELEEITISKQRLGVLNLEIHPENPTRKTGFSTLNKQSFVNGINAVPIISDLFALNGNWDARKQNMEKQTAILEPLAKDGELLEEIEGKCKLKDGTPDKEKFAKSAVNILSRDDNKDLLEEYLKGEGKKLSEEEITKAITDVNKAKHILLTGENFDKNITIQNPTQESGKKQFIEALGYKTKAELELMGLKETNDCVEILGKDFGFTLGDKGEIKHTKPATQSENYKKELKSANNINNKLKEGAEGKLNYSIQNKESEEQKTKEKTEKKANNQTYSRTSTNTPQSGMSAENMAGNAAVLGGAIAAAAVIPFVGWIVALAILYSFKDKFKDDPKAEKELYENVAKGLEKEGGQTPAEAQKIISDLKKKGAELNNGESENKIITDLGEYLEKNPEVVNEITNILKEKNNEKELKEFLIEKVYKGNPTDEEKKAIDALLKDPNGLKKTLGEVIDNIEESQGKIGNEKHDNQEKDGKELPNSVFVKNNFVKNNKETNIFQSQK